MLISERIKGCASGGEEKTARIHRIERVETIGKYVPTSRRVTFAPQTPPPRLIERGQDDARSPSRRIHGETEQLVGQE